MAETGMVRVVVYVSPAKHRKLKSVLALEGDSVSEWFRKEVDNKIDSSDGTDTEA